MRPIITASAAIISVASAIAQAQSPAAPELGKQWQEIAARSTNKQGFKVWGFTLTRTAAGCEGGHYYQSASDSNATGFSPHRFTNARQMPDGSILCSGGTWYYGRDGSLGGKTADVLIKDGKYYRYR